jgi:hypothetical protein
MGGGGQADRGHTVGLVEMQVTGPDGTHRS